MSDWERGGGAHACGPSCCSACIQGSPKVRATALDGAIHSQLLLTRVLSFTVNLSHSLESRRQCFRTRFV